MEAFEPDISTHTPLTARDSCVSSGVIESLKISTHTPLTGRDITLDEIQEIIMDFYSHAPYGT